MNELSEEETDDIAAIMKSNKESKQQQAATEEVELQYGTLKRTLKAYSKSQLIEIIWAYGLQLQEIQSAATFLLEENKALKDS